MTVFLKYGVFGALMAPADAGTIEAPATDANATGTASGRVKMCKIEQDIPNGLLRFNFQDPAKTVEVFEVSRCSEEINIKAMFHGYQQKMQDSYASAKGNFADAILWMKETREQLYAGNWTVGSSGPGANTLWIEALAEIKGKTVDEVLVSVAKLTDDQKKAIKNLDAVKNMSLKIQIRRAEEQLAKSGGSTDASASADVLAAI